MTAKLIPIGLSTEDLTLLNSMVSIVAIRTDMAWKVTPGDEGGVYFVDDSSYIGRNFLETCMPGLPIICYGAAAGHALSVAKPLRARDLVKALESLSPAVSQQKAPTPVSWAAALQNSFQKAFG